MIAKCAGIGPGGLIPSPAAASASGKTIAAMAMVRTSRNSPLAGWLILATNGGLAPHSTTAITCIGIRQRVKNVTSPANEGKSNSEMKPSETAIATSDAAMPSPGCATRTSDVGAAAPPALRLRGAGAIIGGGARDV